MWYSFLWLPGFKNGSRFTNAVDSFKSVTWLQLYGECDTDSLVSCPQGPEGKGWSFVDCSVSTRLTIKCYGIHGSQHNNYWAVCLNSSHHSTLYVHTTMWHVQLCITHCTRWCHNASSTYHIASSLNHIVLCLYHNPHFHIANNPCSYTIKNGVNYFWSIPIPLRFYLIFKIKIYF